MKDLKAATFIVFVSLIMLGAVMFVKLEADFVGAIVFVVLGILLLNVFVKVVAK